MCGDAEKECGWLYRSAGDAGGTSRKGDSKKRKSTGVSGPLSSKACFAAWHCLDLQHHVNNQELCIATCSG